MGVKMSIDVGGPVLDDSVGKPPDIKRSPGSSLIIEFDLFLRAIMAATTSKLAANCSPSKICDTVFETILIACEINNGDKGSVILKKFLSIMETKLEETEEETVIFVLRLFVLTIKHFNERGDGLWLDLLENNNSLLERIAYVMNYHRNSSPELQSVFIEILSVVVPSTPASEWYLTKFEHPFDCLLLTLDSESCIAFASGIAFVQSILLEKIELSHLSRKIFKGSVITLALEKITRTLRKDNVYRNMAPISCGFLLDVLTSGCEAAVHLIRRRRMVEKTLWMLTSDDRRCRFNSGSLLAALNRCEDEARSIVDDLLALECVLKSDMVHIDLQDLIICRVNKKLHNMDIYNCNDVIIMNDALQLILDNICYMEKILITGIQIDYIRNSRRLIDLLNILAVSAVVISKTNKPVTVQESHNSNTAFLREYTTKLILRLSENMNPSSSKNIYLLYSTLIRTFDRVHKSLNYFEEKEQLILVDFLINAASTDKIQQGQQLKHLALMCLKSFVSECKLDNVYNYVLDNLLRCSLRKNLIHRVSYNDNINLFIVVFKSFLPKEDLNERTRTKAMVVIKRIETAISETVVYQSGTAITILEDLVNEIPQHYLTLFCKDFIVLLLSKIKLDMQQCCEKVSLQKHIIPIMKCAEIVYNTGYLYNLDNLGQTLIHAVVELMNSTEKETRMGSLFILHKIIFSNELLRFTCIDRGLSYLSSSDANLDNPVGNSEHEMDKSISVVGTLRKLFTHFNSPIVSEKKSELCAELTEFSINLVCKLLETFVECHECEEKRTVELALKLFFFCRCDSLIINSARTTDSSLSTSTLFELLQIDKPYVFKCFNKYAQELQSFLSKEDGNIQHRTSASKLHTFIKEFLFTISSTNIKQDSSKCPQDFKIREKHIIEQLRMNTNLIEDLESYITDSHYECTEC